MDEIKYIDERFNAKEELSLKTKLSLYTHLSGRHIISLEYICKRLFEIENIAKYDNDKMYRSEHTALSHSAVILSACLLESTINEFFCDTVYAPSNLKEVSDEKISLIRGMWELGVPKTANYKILDKYQIALTLLNKPIFSKGNDSAYQNANLLIKLRNQIIHSEAEITTDDKTDKTESAKFQKSLASKFKVKKGTEKIGNPFFPDKVFGYGCAEWSAKSAVDFIKEFYSRAGLRSELDFLNQMIDHNNLSTFK